MAYLGNIPAERYTSMTKQDITGDGGASYTLDHAVGSEAEIEVFVNNVRQEPTSAYTVAGTALTMTGNVAASDDFYVVFQGKALQTTTHPAGNDLEAVDGTFTGVVALSGNVPIWENKQTINADYTITDGYNAMSAGAITIASGVTVTVGTGETWTIV